MDGIFNEKMFTADERPPKAGWATGNYSNKCSLCGNMFTGDKRAFHCADCAYGTKEQPNE